MTKFKLAIILITLPFFALGANPPSILVSIKPIHSIIANITNEVTDPELLLDSNISPHTYALKPSDVKKMSDSDIIIYTSSNIENFLGKSIDNLKNDKITIELIKIEGLTLLPNRTSNKIAIPEPDEHQDEHHDENHIHDYNIDPHIWLLPDNIAVIAKYITDILTNHDPANALKYKNNLMIFLDKLEKHNLFIKNKLSPYSGKAFIVYHDAFQYFEKNYGLNNVGHLTSPSNITLGAKKIKQMKDIIKEHNVKCVFREPQFSGTIVQNIGDSSNINVGVLDPIGSEVKAGKNAYFDIIYNLANDFSNCLGKNDTVK
jgi:zinc transport system substrate-binding protein